MCVPLCQCNHWLEDATMCSSERVTDQCLTDTDVTSIGDVLRGSCWGCGWCPVQVDWLLAINSCQWSPAIDTALCRHCWPLSSTVHLFLSAYNTVTHAIDMSSWLMLMLTVLLLIQHSLPLLPFFANDAMRSFLFTSLLLASEPV